MTDVNTPTTGPGTTGTGTTGPGTTGPGTTGTGTSGTGTTGTGTSEPGTGQRGNVEHNPQRDPAEWLTGGEPSTGPQESYLNTLAREAGEEPPAGLTEAEASQEIDRLQGQTGRGR